LFVFDKLCEVYYEVYFVRQLTHLKYNDLKKISFLAFYIYFNKSAKSNSF